MPRVLIVLITILSSALVGCDALLGGEDEQAVTDYACINSVGWILDPGGRGQYEQHAIELLHEAEDEDLAFQQDVFSDLLGWYTSGNELAVQAFVDVNDCMDRVNRQLEEES